MMELIRLFLQQQWQVVYASAAAKSEHMVDLEALGLQTAEIRANDSGFDRFISELSPDIVLFDRFIMEEQFGWRVESSCPQAMRMVETIDLHCLRDTRHQLVKQQQRVVQDVEPALLLESEMARREVASIFRSDLTLLISDYELNLVKEQFAIPDSLLHLCPFMFDEQMIVKAPAFDERHHFITVGNFRHAPNWDSVLWLKQTIWPLIRKRLPDAELHIYGAYPPKKATALHAPKDGFHLKGWAEDALDVMKQARICLAPLRFGAGIKGKLADAMLAGTPSVTTSVGAESMSGGLPWCGSIEDEAEALADAAVALYQNRSRWQQAQQHGYAIVRTLFNGRQNGEALISRIHEVFDSLQIHRRNNFTGSMLRHHQHRSTEYMSRWIEVKNRQGDCT